MRDIWPRFEFNWDYYLHYQYYPDIFIYKCKSVNVNMNVYLYTIWYAWDIVVHSCSVYPTIYIYTLYIYIYILLYIHTHIHMTVIDIPPIWPSPPFIYFYWTPQFLTFFDIAAIISMLKETVNHVTCIFYKQRLYLEHEDQIWFKMLAISVIKEKEILKIRNLKKNNNF